MPPSRRPAPLRRLVAAGVAVLLVLGLAACNPDPTGGKRPPAPGASVPAFSYGTWAITRADVALSWRTGCPVHWSDLRALNVAYWDYTGQRRTGNLVLHHSVVTQVRDVFRALYDTRFQVARIRHIDHYGADDDRSMAANNTSAFNCRTVAGTSTWSEHSYGTAIDINPVQNPYVVGSSVYPPAGRDWVDRRFVTPGMIARNDVVWTSFHNRGWKWGGDWTSKKDYQHFSVTGR